MPRDFKDRVREQFGRSAEGYVRNRGFATGDDLTMAVELLKPTAEDNLLDVACGGGHTALHFAPLVRSVVASDLTVITSYNIHYTKLYEIWARTGKSSPKMSTLSAPSTIRRASVPRAAKPTKTTRNNFV